MHNTILSEIAGLFGHRASSRAYIGQRNCLWQSLDENRGPFLEAQN
jgi:hypothetical protein